MNSAFPRLNSNAIMYWEKVIMNESENLTIPITYFKIQNVIKFNKINLWIWYYFKSIQI